MIERLDEVWISKNRFFKGKVILSGTLVVLDKFSRVFFLVLLKFIIV